MSFMLQDGTGSGSFASVDGNNRLDVSASSGTKELFAIFAGDAYNLNTGPINLTNAAETPVMYVKNNEQRDLVVTAIAVGTGISNGTANEEIAVKVIRNPTAGTTISNANAVDMNQNRNFGSSNTLTVDAYKGATGETMTDGDDIILFYAQDSQRLFGVINLILSQGKSLGVKVTPPPSNTDMNVYVALICHLRDENE